MIRFKQDPWIAEFVREHVVAVAIDAYHPGTAADVAFLDRLHAQNAATGNHFAYATASGKWLGSDYVGGTPEKMKKVVEEWKTLPEAERKPRIGKATRSAGEDKVGPQPPAGALTANVFCVHLKRDAQGELSRVTSQHAGSSPVEPEIDKMWLAEAEWKSLVPADAKKGDRFPLPDRLRKRMCSKHAVQYMIGSTGEVPLRGGEMKLTVEKAGAGGVELRLDGYALMGETFEELKSKPRPTDVHAKDAYGGISGCDIRLLGYLKYDASKKAFTRFDVVGIGESWGHLTNWSLGGDGAALRRWPYGVAFALAPADAPADRVPPYNMVAYNMTEYFKE